MGVWAGDCTDVGLWLLVRGLSAPAHIDAGAESIVME